MSSIDLSTTNPINAFRARIDLQILNRSNNKQEGGGTDNINSTDKNSSNSVNVENAANDTIGEKTETREKRVIDELKRRDAEVRSHEQAHKAVAGRFASGGISFKLERGPNGRFFAVGGHVNLDVSEESTPEETIQKMQTIRKAALAPANPSAQDRAVAADATSKEAEVRRELMQEKAENRNEIDSIDKNNRFKGMKPGQNLDGAKFVSGFEFTRLEGSLLDRFI